MELSTKAVVVIVIMALLLVSFGSFFVFRSGEDIGMADARKMFEEKCIAYQKRGCSWEVTEEADFQQFLQACKRVYGPDKEEFSCLYAMCQQCKEFDPVYTQCAGRCSGIAGQKKLGFDVQQSCQVYGEECPVPRCGACG